MSDEINAPKTEQQSSQESAPQQESNDLTVADLNGMKTIIDLASSRGAFKPGEMVVVGQTYNKLTSFLNSVQKQQGAQ
jgi:hypothetical protein